MGLVEKNIGTGLIEIGGRSQKLIQWIDHLLEKWARWRSAAGWHGGGCGISSLLLTEHNQINRAVNDCGGPDDLMLTIDQAVLCLPDELRRVVAERYEKGGTGEQKAAAVGMNRMTFQRRLVTIHQAVRSAIDSGIASVPLLAPKHYAKRHVAKCQRQTA